MKRFRFSLETVLKVRRDTEEARARELALARAQRDRGAAQVAELEGALRDLLLSHSLERAKGLSLGVEAWYRDRTVDLDGRLAGSREELKALEEAMEVCRLKAVEASRDRLVLEKLQERQFQEHQAEAAREEQALIDDRAQRSRFAFGSKA